MTVYDRSAEAESVRSINQSCGTPTEFARKCKQQAVEVRRTVLRSRFLDGWIVASQKI